MESLIIRVAILDVDIAVYQVANSCKKETDLQVVKRTMDLYLRNWLSITNSSLYVGYITDSSSNFRIAVAQTWPYKGQRSKEKPIWYQAMRDYVQEHWGIQMVVGIEADDALTIAAERLKATHEVVIVTEDKDLLQYPALHYNPHKNPEVFEVTESQGHYNLWHQVITGDRTDNIPGVSHAITETTMGSFNRRISESELHYKDKMSLFKKYPRQELIGASTARDYLANFKPEEYPQKVWELYIDKYEDPEDGGSERYGDFRFSETFTLIYMLREAPEGVEVLVEPQGSPVPEGVIFMEF